MDDFEGDGSRDVILTGVYNDLGDPHRGMAARFEGTNIWGEALSAVHHEDNTNNGSHLYYKILDIPAAIIESDIRAHLAIDTDANGIKDSIVGCSMDGLRLLSASTGSNLWFHGPNQYGSAEVIYPGTTQAFLVCQGMVLPGGTNSFIEGVNINGSCRWFHLMSGSMYGTNTEISEVKVIDLDDDRQVEIVVGLRGRFELLDVNGNQRALLDTGGRESFGFTLLPAESNRVNLLGWSSSNMWRFSWSDTRELKAPIGRLR